MTDSWLLQDILFYKEYKFPFISNVKSLQIAFYCVFLASVEIWSQTSVYRIFCVYVRPNFLTTLLRLTFLTSTWKTEWNLVFAGSQKTTRKLTVYVFEQINKKALQRDHDKIKTQMLKYVQYGILHRERDHRERCSLDVPRLWPRSVLGSDWKSADCL